MVGHNLKMRIGEMRLARHSFPAVLHHGRSVVAAVLSGNCRVYRIFLFVWSTGPMQARVRVTETCFASSKGNPRSFDRDFLDAEIFFSKCVASPSAGRLDQIWSPDRARNFFVSSATAA